MGEIIRFDFKKGKRIDDKKEPSDKKETVSKKTEGKNINNESEDELLRRYALLIIKTGNFKKLMQLPVSPSTLETNKQIVKDYTTEELLGWLEDKEESDWVAKASFFQAIYNELKLRFKL